MSSLAPTADPTVSVVTPLANVLDFNDRVEVSLDLPGVNEGDLDVKIQQNLLLIKAVSSPARVEGYRLLAGNGDTVEYRRSFRIASDIDTDAVQASLSNGVLTIHLPKRPSAMVRSIPITVNVN